MVYILHKVAPGEDGDCIARMYNIPPCVIPKDIRAGNTLKIAIGKNKVLNVIDYIIKPIDTLESIARHFSVGADKILRENENIHPYVGERIKIIR